jgi:phage-related holin
MVTKYIDIHVLPKLASALVVSASFDLWMSKRGIDTFALVVNYLSKAWELVHVIVNLFEVNETIGFYMAQQLQSLLEKFSLIH